MADRRRCDERFLSYRYSITSGPSRRHRTVPARAGPLSDHGNEADIERLPVVTNESPSIRIHSDKDPKKALFCRANGFHRSHHQHTTHECQWIPCYRHARVTARPAGWLLANERMDCGSRASSAFDSSPTIRRAPTRRRTTHESVEWKKNKKKKKKTTLGRGITPTSTEFFPVLGNERLSHHGRAPKEAFSPTTHRTQEADEGRSGEERKKRKKASETTICKSVGGSILHKRPLFLRQTSLAKLHLGDTYSIRPLVRQPAVTERMESTVIFGLRHIRRNRDTTTHAS